MLLRPPGVYRPQADTALLATTVRDTVPPGARVLELGTGTGALAVTAARAGAAHVTAIDVAARAVLTARLNARANRLPIRVLRGDLFTPVEGETFDLIIANPPYVPGDPDPATGTVRGAARAWEGGPDGRAILDRICGRARDFLTPHGTLLLVHSALNGVDATLLSLHRAGMRATVVARHREPFGPVMRRRAAALRARGVLRTGQHCEELVAVRADMTAAGEETRDARHAA
ncbi:HemK2/MTQ2 family protein methyltransferase [Spirillospora albida]|uniref:HemK2/MTQ2 family protein methyltransferase n=1 Tax=Spirillospora albida TaxID=58123 RepID=UPI00055B10AF|nr:HemK2/MTQ2 family protein methyltransferase [Spirillospora albida]